MIELKHEVDLREGMSLLIFMRNPFLQRDLRKQQFDCMNNQSLGNFMSHDITSLVASWVT